MTRFTPQWLQQGSYAASVDRRLIGVLWPTPATSGCAVTVATGMTVNVAAGQVAVPTANGTGTLLCSSDAVEQVALTAAPAAGTNRYDLIICQARGNDIDGGANNDFLFTVTTGTAAASPTVPAVPNNAVAVAQIYVPGGSASVTAGNITDRRVPLVDHNKMPQGRLPGGYAQRTTNFAATTEAAVGVSITVNVPANRLIRLEASVSAIDGTQQASWLLIRIREGSVAGTRIVQTTYTPNAAPAAGGGMSGRTITPSAGVHTYLMTLESAGGGTATITGAAADNPIWLEAIDVGGV